MAEETRYDHEPAGQEYFGHDDDRRRGEYRGGDYGRREEFGRGAYGGAGYRGEGRGRYGSEGGYGREDRGRGGGYGSGYGGRDYGRSGYGYGREGPGYGGYGREDYGRRSGEDYRYGRDRGYAGGGQYGRGGYGGRGEERGFWDRASDEVSSWFGDEDAERRREMDERRGGAWRSGGGGYGDYGRGWRGRGYGYGVGGDLEGVGEHRGRGPVGYTRSDERIREDVCDRLTDDPHIDASRVEVTVSNGEVTLSGMVNSRWDKRHAEDCVEDLSGVKHVQNNLRVQQAGLGGTAGQAANTARQGQGTPAAANEPGGNRGRSSAA